MGITGRRPKPTALKILNGNPGKRPLPKDEPTPPVGKAVRPEMSPEAARVWDEYAPLIAGMGLLTRVDVPAFAMLCALVAEAQRGPEQMHAARIARLESLFGRFGMDPSSRARMGGLVPKEKKNPFQQLA